MRRVNPDTLEIEIVNKKSTPAVQYVYVLQDTGAWDYEETNTTEVYAKFKNAVKSFTQRVRNAKRDLREWCNEDDLVEDYDVNEEKECASYSGYEEDEYEKLHCEIWIEKQEVR